MAEAGEDRQRRPVLVVRGEPADRIGQGSPLDELPLIREERLPATEPQDRHARERCEGEEGRGRSAFEDEGRATDHGAALAACVASGRERVGSQLCGSSLPSIARTTATPMTPHASGAGTGATASAAKIGLPTGIAKMP